MAANDPTVPPRSVRAADSASTPPLSPDTGSESPTTPPDQAPDDDATIPPSPNRRPAAPVEIVPGYELLAELGRGGMGVVYKARDTRLNRVVALKMVLSGSHADQKELVRFLAEAEAVASIEHPHVVRVFGYGEHDGRPYMVLEFCAGGTLSGWIKTNGQLVPNDAAALVGEVARGVQAAHDLGIVHRDLKPQNVLITEDGAPKVTDFGIAKRRGGSGLTQTNAVMGTPAYMSPEQARGQTKFVGPAADVYALGVILYECLAGRPPFQGPDAVAVIMKVIEEHPPPLSRFARSVPHDLQLICRKCLAKEPHDRYPTAAALANDLARFQRGEPISVRPAGLLERGVKWVKRRPTVATAYALAVLSLFGIGLSAGAVWLWQRTERARVDAENARGEAVTARDELAKEREIISRINYGRTIQIVYQMWKDDKFAEARLLLASTRPDLRGWEYDYIHRLCHPDLVTFDRVTYAAFSPDGSRVFTTSEYEETARVWDAVTGKTVCAFEGQPGPLTSALWCPDSSKVLTVSTLHNNTYLWDAASGKTLAKFDGINPAELLSADWSKVITVSDDYKTARVWDAASGKILAELKHTSPVNSVVLSTDGSKALTASDDRTARIWDAASGKVLVELKGHTLHTLPVIAVAFSPDGSKVVTRSNGGKTAHVWDAATGKMLAEFRSHSVLFSPDGSKILTRGDDYKTAHVSDAATGRTLAVLNHTNGIDTIAFSADGSKVLTRSELGRVEGGKTARVWDAATGKLFVEVYGAGSVMINGNASKVLTGNDDGTACIWDGATGKALVEFKGHTGRVNSAVFSADGSKVVTAGNDRTTRVWDAATGKALAEFKGHTGGVGSAVFNANGSKILTTSSDNTARVWDAVLADTLSAIEGHTPPIRLRGAAVLSGDGSRGLAIRGSGMDGGWSVRVWEVATETPLAELKHPLPVHTAVFNANGSKALTGCSDGKARIWDAASGKVLVELTGHTAGVVSVAFSPDESRILTGGGDGTARLWDAESGAEVLALPGRGYVAFSTDGTRIFTGLHPAMIYDSRPVNRAFIKP